MNKLEKLLAIGLVATGISVAPAHSQTCTVPPSCDALGFTKSTTDCVGLDTLRCPFDQSKVFCSKVPASTGGGTAGNPDNPLAAIGSYNTYELGSKFYDDKGEFIGYFAGGSYVFDLSKELFAKYEDIKDYCQNKTTGGLNWQLLRTSPNSNNVINNQALYNIVKGMYFIKGTYSTTSGAYVNGSYISDLYADYFIYYSHFLKHDETTPVFEDFALEKENTSKDRIYPTLTSPMHIICQAEIKTYY